jgi:hypothetical protein
MARLVSTLRRLLSADVRWVGIATVAACALTGSIEAASTPQFSSEIRPLLREFCGDCHADGEKKGGIDFDALATEESAQADHAVWLAVLKNVRAGLMPPARKSQPSAEQKQRLEQWIKSAVFHADPADPDPGHVVVRRLNRTEYRNTIQDLLGVEFDTQVEFPADDSGHGFDNLGEVLTVSPMLLEKYLAAAQTIVERAVPGESALPAETVISGKQFAATNAPASGKGKPATGPLTLSYYEPARVTHHHKFPEGGTFKMVLDLGTTERFVDNQFDYNQCRITLRIDGQEVWTRSFTREGNRPFQFALERTLSAGDHVLEFELQPLTPDQKHVRSLGVRLDSLTLRGPMERQHWVKPAHYARFFPKDPPADNAGRRRYARELIEPFARRAFRRPVDAATVDRLTSLAEGVYADGAKPFEAGIRQAFVAILASPRFLFREEFTDSMVSGGKYPFVDEYALASRLSYFFWSTMPDEELLRLAGDGKLRANLEPQVRRLMADARFDGFIRNFVGQWLQARDIENVSIDARQVLAREAVPDPAFEAKRDRFRALRQRTESDLTPEERKELEVLRPEIVNRNNAPVPVELNGDLRRAMRQETEKTVAFVIREDRPLHELLDSDYVFVNERLAKHYGLTNLTTSVTGDELRRVSLPAESSRGGLITQGTILAVTSNPTRTSPVKRGLFILDNILGTPPPPPPPDVSPLEDASKRAANQTPTLREMLALHREKPLCSGCHNRMDPLGLALENFNAMGLWRDAERGQPVDTSGVLLTGEAFKDVRELKRILATRHAADFYRTLTEKMLTYALGRGLRETDVETVDQIVAAVLHADGKPSALIAGITTSAPFLKTRLASDVDASPASPKSSPRSPQQRADARNSNTP